MRALRVGGWYLFGEKMCEMFLHRARPISAHHTIPVLRLLRPELAGRVVARMGEGQRTRRRLAVQAFFSGEASRREGRGKRVGGRQAVTEALR